MSRKTVKYNKTGVSQLPDDKPVVYTIQTEGGKANYVGVAKKGRVQERLEEHLNDAEIPGAKVKIEQMSSIKDAREKEQSLISKINPKYNDLGT